MTGSIGWPLSHALRAAAPEARAELVALGERPGVRVAEAAPDAITFEIVGRPGDVAAFEALVRPHGVLELARTGRIGLRRPTAVQPAKEGIR